MFPPIFKSPTDKMKVESPKVTDSQLITTKIEEEEEESDEFYFDENEYNIEFDFQLKKSVSSKRLNNTIQKESNKLENNQYSHNSFERTKERFTEKEWITHEDDSIDEEDFSRSIFEELDQMEKKLSSDEESDSSLIGDENDRKPSTSFNHFRDTLNDVSNDHGDHLE